MVNVFPSKLNKRSTILSYAGHRNQLIMKTADLPDAVIAFGSAVAQLLRQLPQLQPASAPRLASAVVAEADLPLKQQLLKREKVIQ